MYRQPQARWSAPEYTVTGIPGHGHVSRDYWPFVRIIYRSPVDSPHKSQWCGAFDVFFDLRLNNQPVEQTIETPMFWDAFALIMASPWYKYDDGWAYTMPKSVFDGYRPFWISKKRKPKCTMRKTKTTISSISLNALKYLVNQRPESRI